MDQKNQQRPGETIEKLEECETVLAQSLEKRRTLPPDAVEPIETALHTVRETIPAMKMFVQEQKRIQDFILNPVTKMLEVTSQDSINAITKSANDSTKNDKISILLGLLGLIIGILGFIGGVFDGVKIPKKEDMNNVANIKPVNYKSLSLRLSERLNYNPSENIAYSFRAKIITSLQNIDKSICYTTLRNSYDTILAKVENSANISVENSFVILNFYLELIKTNISSNMSNDSNLITTIDNNIPLMENDNQRDELVWIKAELLRSIGKLDSAIICYQKLSKLNKNILVIDIQSIKQIDLKLVSVKRLSEVELTACKNLCKIYLVNSSVSNSSQLINTLYASLTQKYGYKNVFKVNDLNPTSSIFAYYRDSNAQICMEDIFRILSVDTIYPKSTILAADKTCLLKTGNSWVKKELFENSVADIVISGCPKTL